MANELDYLRQQMAAMQNPYMSALQQTLGGFNGIEQRNYEVQEPPAKPPSFLNRKLLLTRG